MNVNKASLLLLGFSFFVFNSAFSQGGTWTWISGDSAANSSGVYGTQGVPSKNNHPPSKYEGCEWKDKNGDFWIYGGTYQSYSDLWKYNPITNEWTWIKGTGLQGQSPVFGTQGVASPSNTPGERSHCAATWVDTSGTFWLFGGVNDNIGEQNDLWKYDIDSSEWTWVTGDTIANSKAVHGTQGMPSPSNTPGARHETCSAWTDSLNNLWLFGGSGYDENDSSGFLNDLWKYDISTNEWTWMKGSALIDAPANYGIKGLANASNDPGARWSYTKWKDAQGNFWIMGGDYIGSALNDVWKYNLSVNEWTWISGTNVLFSAGDYESNCVFDTVNFPYARYEQRSSVTDNCHRFWLFGGADPPFTVNDLWVFDAQELKWNWISGTNVPYQAESYGILGVPSPSNIPSSRMGADAWWGNDNKFYMFGGINGFYSNNFNSDMWVFTPDTNCVPVSCNAVAATKPVASFQSSDTTFCAYNCINFTDLSTNNPTSWKWNFAGGIHDTSTAQNPQNICYYVAGNYNVTLIASNSSGSDTLSINNFITVNPSPPDPNITQSHDTLFCATDPSYIYYQWYEDTSLISFGGKDTFLIINRNGDYNVEVTNSYCCNVAVGIDGNPPYILSLINRVSHISASTAPCGITDAVQNYTSDNIISLSPNPVDKQFTVYGLQFTVSRVEIYNVVGQEASPPASLSPGPSPKERGVATIDVSFLPSGIYFIQLIGEKERWTGRFVKE